MGFACGAMNGIGGVLYREVYTCIAVVRLISLHVMLLIGLLVTLAA